MLNYSLQQFTHENQLKENIIYSTSDLQSCTLVVPIPVLQAVFFSKDHTADQKAKYFAMLWYFLTYLRFTYPTCCSWPLYVLTF